MVFLVVLDGDLEKVVYLFESDYVDNYFCIELFIFVIVVKVYYGFGDECKVGELFLMVKCKNIEL